MPPATLLNKILSPDDLKNLSIIELNELANLIREKIISTLSINGGHLASNLGVIELTIAMHKVFNSPIDKFIFDTSHQIYTHKILTGRHDRFSTIRQYKGLCGFSDPTESKHDPFYLGHAGTALSLSLGLSYARDFKKEEEHIIPLLGDASINCGLTLEALNHIPKNLKNFIVILNDNNMAISKNVGNIKNILSRLVNHPISNKLYLEIQSLLSKIPGYGKTLAEQGQKITESIKNLVSPAIFFEHFGLTYVGPIDGHDIKKLCDTLLAIKDAKKPALLHVMTQKGKGMELATANPTSYHGVKPFDKITGKMHKSTNNQPTFPKIFGKEIVKMAEKDPTIFALSPAMVAGSCLEEFFQKFKDRSFDVGIAEGHGVTFAAGLAAKKNTKVLVSIYSTFLQRAFDNVFHDICLQNFPVVFAIDRAGLNGPDGSTHHGIYDIGFLAAMPNMVITQPRNAHVLKELLRSAFFWEKPTAIRYPNIRTTEPDLPIKQRELGKAEILTSGKELIILALGHCIETAFAINKILEQYKISITIIDPVFIKPLDKELFLHTFKSHRYLVTIEEHAKISGFGMLINSFLIENKISHLQVLNCGIEDHFVEHGSNEEILKEIGLDAISIAKKIASRFDLEKREEKIHDLCTVSP